MGGAWGRGKTQTKIASVLPFGPRSVEPHAFVQCQAPRHRGEGTAVPPEGRVCGARRLYRAEDPERARWDRMKTASRVVSTDFCVIQGNALTSSRMGKYSKWKFLFPGGYKAGMAARRRKLEQLVKEGKIRRERAEVVRPSSTPSGPARLAFDRKMPPDWKTGEAAWAYHCSQMREVWERELEAAKARKVDERHGATAGWRKVRG